MLIHRDGWRYSGRVPAFFPGQSGCFCCAASVTNLYRTVYGLKSGGAALATNNEYTGSWAARTAAARTTFRPTGGSVADGIGYFAYGINSGATANADKYTSSGDSWTALTAPSAVRNNKAGTMPAKFYTSSGDDGGGGYKTEHDEYDPTGNTWTSKTAVPGTARAQTRSGNDGTDVWAFAGVDASFTLQNRTDKYSVGGDSWTSKTAMSTGRYGYGTFILPGYIYVCGGNNGSTVYDLCDRYDVSGDSWTGRAAIGNNHTVFGCCSVTASSVGYATAGASSSGTTLTLTHDEYVENSWTNRTGLPSDARQGNFSVQC